MAITEWDDYLIHQTASPIDAPGDGDEDFMDRLFFGCHDTEGKLHLVLMFGSYPNRNIMDAVLVVRHNGTQHNLRLSRHLQGDRANMQIGPLTLKIIEPLKRWGIYLDNNDYGLSCSLEFEGRGAPTVTMPGGHYDQLGRYKGTITIDGQQFSADGFIGNRDRSWGVRRKLLGDQMTGHLWIQTHFPTFGLSMLYSGLYADQGFCLGAIFHDDGTIIPIKEVRQRLNFEPGVRLLSGVEMLLTDANGKQRQLSSTKISPPLYEGGGGYDRNMEDRGPLSIEGETWDVSQPANIGSPYWGVFGLNQRIAQFQLDGETGFGTLESSYSALREREYKATL